MTETLNGELVIDPTKIDCAGALNYVFTELAQEYIRQKGLRYQNINDIIGALEGAKMEFYRRVAAGYEDTKIEDNGDVFLFKNILIR